MTPEASLHTFMSGFGIPAYVSSSVPDEAQYPYLTYAPVMGEFNGGEVNVPVNLWYHGTSESVPNAKAREMFVAIGPGGRCLPCDGGMLWVKRGTPWCQAMTDDDSVIRRRLINVSIETITYL